jgi:hypothetical protein
VKAPCFQDWDELSPTRAIGEGSMNQHNVLDWLLLRLCLTSASERCSGTHAGGENCLHHRFLLIV